MSWFRIDDKSAFHRKVLKAGNEAWGAICRAGAVSAGEGTDGRVTKETMLAIAPMKVWQRAITAGLVERVDDTSFQLHDYLQWNESAAEIEARAAARRKKSQDAAEARWGARGRLRRQEDHSDQAQAVLPPSPADASGMQQASTEHAPSNAPALPRAHTPSCSSPYHSDPYAPSERVARAHARLPDGHLTADAIAAELAAHHRLAQLATDPDFPSTLLSRAMGKGTKAEWLVDAIADAAADTPAGEQSHATMKRVRAYCDRARPPRHDDERGSSSPKATSDAERMVPIETADGLRLRDDDPRIEFDGASGLRGWDWEKHGKPPAKLPVGVRHWNAPGPKPSLLGGAS